MYFIVFLHLSHLSVLRSETSLLQSPVQARSVARLSLLLRKCKLEKRAIAWVNKEVEEMTYSICGKSSFFSSYSHRKASNQPTNSKTTIFLLRKQNTLYAGAFSLFKFDEVIISVRTWGLFCILHTPK